MGPLWAINHDAHTYFKAKLCALLQYTFSLALIVFYLITIGIRSSALEKVILKSYYDSEFMSHNL